MHYQVLTLDGKPTDQIRLIQDDGSILDFPEALDNWRYLQFKELINDDKAELYGADGNLMTPEEAKAYVATLP
jgi:hypothetical protein